ncbi:16S rRNA (guanine(966)-N(2))-methyltransferase RsmD [Candidatus Saccharibacteria bacterium]|nr:16S rRNA (guanine(966)-N(2))-methyltransferase RsmD [Candidatus Saccharibacteria bacterium]
MRVIAGLYGGRNIQAPDTVATHPMSERVRNALFNIVSDEIKGAVVLDAFAGSGALGLEALSRGASHVTFIERDSRAISTLKDNIALFNLAGQSGTTQADVASWIDSCNTMFDVILVDPPYDDIQLLTVMKLKKLLKPNALMILSYPGSGEVPTANGVVVVDNRSYGTAALAFYRLETV